MSIRHSTGASTRGTAIQQPLVILCIAAGLLSLAGCRPRVEVAVPDKPIEINLNVKIDHDIKVRVERDLDNVISKDSGLF